MAVSSIDTGQSADLIRQVPIFAELSDAEASELWHAGQRVSVAPGEVFIREGDLGGSLYIILKGAVEVTKQDGDHDVTLATRGPGEFLGEMSLLEQAPRTASVRATEPSELLAIGSQAFRQLLARRPEAAATLLRTVTSRLRSTEASLVQSDKLAALGTLAAGLAHELNNPAAAIQRSTGYLSEAFEGWRRRTVELSMLEMTPGERQGLAELERSIADCRATRCSDADARRLESRLSPGDGGLWLVGRAPGAAAHYFCRTARRSGTAVARQRAGGTATHGGDRNRLEGHLQHRAFGESLRLPRPGARAGRRYPDEPR